VPRISLALLQTVAAAPVVFDGPFHATRLFWSYLALLPGAMLFAAWRAREKNHRLRQKELARAVDERTEEIRRQREREREKNQILEMLVANEPMGSVFDRTLHLLKNEAPETMCAILLRHGAGCRVAASSGFSEASSAFPQDPLGFAEGWLRALQFPRAVPFEVWQAPLSWQNPGDNPAWKLFHEQIRGGDPSYVRSWPVTSGTSTVGVLLQFWPPHSAAWRPDMSPEIPPEAEGTAEAVTQLVCLAIEHNRMYEDLQFQIRHDPLTGLANRVLFEERLERGLREAQQRRQKLAVLFVDLDRFKEVNDTLNHRAGDQCLCEIAGRMKNAVRPMDLVARIGGDEFIVMVPNVKDAEEASMVAERVLTAIQEPLSIEGYELHPTASAGVAVFPDDAVNSEQLQRFADTAMYSAKESGRNCVQLFARRNETLDRARLEDELRTALRQGHFVVYYQAKVSQEGRLMGFEALLRLNHPKFGLIPPLEFIPTAEKSGLIVPIGAWVLVEVCRQIADWRMRGYGEIAVAVNVSAVQLDQPDFAESVAACLRRSGVAPWHLELELTESVLVTGSERAQRQMRQLRALGVRLSIDDFGTGYSSLSYLHRLQVDTVKLDQSFVQPIEKDKMARWLVQAMIGIAQGLGLGVIAEGVETEGQRAALIAAGCPIMQGFLFARPAPATELEPILRLSTTDSPLNRMESRPGMHPEGEESDSEDNGNSAVPAGMDVLAGMSDCDTFPAQHAER